MDSAEPQPQQVERPGWRQKLVWIGAALSPLPSWLITFSSDGYNGRTRDEGLWALGGGLLCIVVAIVGLVRHHKPSRWPDVALVVYGVLMTLRGIVRCGISGFGEHDCVPFWLDSL